VQKKGKNKYRKDLHLSQQDIHGVEAGQGKGVLAWFGRAMPLHDV
jgi:hypothetical protein